MTFEEKRKALQFHRDVFEIAKYLAWHSDVGQVKAQDIITEIHNGKYGEKSGVWIQYEKVLNKLESELIREIYE